MVVVDVDMLQVSIMCRGVRKCEAMGFSRDFPLINYNYQQCWPIFYMKV